MTMALPEPGIAVDPGRVTAHLRQMHAQRMDAADFQLAQLTAALEDAQTTVGELRVRAEELGNENVALRARITKLEAQVRELPQAAEPDAAVPGPLTKELAKRGRI